MNAVAAVREKRASPRVAVQGHVRYRRIPISERGPHNGAVQEISRGGLRFRSDEFLKCKSNLLLELHLPDAHPIRSLATIAWVRPVPGDDGYEIGGMFVEPTREVRTALEKLVPAH